MVAFQVHLVPFVLSGVFRLGCICHALDDRCKWGENKHRTYLVCDGIIFGAEGDGIVPANVADTDGGCPVSDGIFLCTAADGSLTPATFAGVILHIDRGGDGVCLCAELFSSGKLGHALSDGFGGREGTARRDVFCIIVVWNLPVHINWEVLV